MIDIGNTIIEFDFFAEGRENIMECLKTLFSTTMGTVALDRDFGIDIQILDEPIEIAKSKLSIEYIEKVRKYEPRVRIANISFTDSILQGVLVPKVVFLSA